jgi:uracil-DNA glycosylase
MTGCRPYLTSEIALLKHVKVIVPLGRIGHEAWLRASGWWDKLPAAERPAFAHLAESQLPDETTVLCSYHPSRQNTNTGRLTRAMWHAVFRRARSLLDPA